MRAGIVAAAARLLVLQASWTYERLQGVGIGYASLPLLEPLAGDPERHRGAVARSVEYFNAHPYLAGIAVGAAARAEQDGVPPDELRRMKTALSGPLGALGDQLFWIGVVPAVAGALLAGVALGGSIPAVILGLLLYVAVRCVVTLWAVETGFTAGADVPLALKTSGLPGQVRRVGNVAGFAVGLALPFLARWLERGGVEGALEAAVAGGVLGAAAAMARRRLPSARRLTVAAIGALILWRSVT